jgi:hypothetical protein
LTVLPNRPLSAAIPDRRQRAAFPHLGFLIRRSSAAILVDLAPPWFFWLVRAPVCRCLMIPCEPPRRFLSDPLAKSICNVLVDVGRL